MRFVTKEEWEDKDFDRQKRRDRTKEEMAKMMTDVYKMLSFTTGVSEDFSNNRLPTLDLELWQTETRAIEYAFFEKEMSSRFVMRKEAATPDQMKRSTLAQDGVRRLMNTSQRLDRREKIQTLETYIKKVKRSGYNKEEVKDIITCSIKRYERKKEIAKKHGKPLHRTGHSSLRARNLNVLTGKTTW